jgi:hypothetical protein
MANWKKIGIISGIGAGVVGIVTYASKLTKASKNLESIVKANLHAIKLEGVTIRIDVQIKNPSSVGFKIKYPFVKVMYKESVVGTSQVIDKIISIPKNGEVNVKGIMITIPYTGLFSVGAGLMKALTMNDAAVITIKTISNVDLGWKKLPYEKSSDITLRAKK